jgi:hypothetical protein
MHLHLHVLGTTQQSILIITGRRFVWDRLLKDEQAH